MSFEKLHLKLHRNDFMPVPYPFPVERVSNDYDRFMDLLKRVGSSSYWDKRKTYHEAHSIEVLKHVLSLPSSLLWIFKKDGMDIGFCQVANVERLANLFNVTSGISEIYKVGLFPEYVGQGLGQGYLTSVLTEIFKNAHTVYLNTRDTNVVNSVPFYEKFGFRVFKTEVLPDDLTHDPG